MATESLVALGLATIFLLLIAIYANRHRAEDKKPKGKDEFDFPE